MKKLQCFLPSFPLSFYLFSHSANIYWIPATCRLWVYSGKQTLASRSWGWIIGTGTARRKQRQKYKGKVLVIFISFLLQPALLQPTLILYRVKEIWALKLTCVLLVGKEKEDWEEDQGKRKVVMTVKWEHVLHLIAGLSHPVPL